MFYKALLNLNDNNMYNEVRITAARYLDDILINQIWVHLDCFQLIEYICNTWKSKMCFEVGLTFDW